MTSFENPEFPPTFIPPAPSTIPAPPPSGAFRDLFDAADDTLETVALEDVAEPPP